MDIKVKVMDIKVKDNECFGTVYAVLHEIDGIDSIRVFTEIDLAGKFAWKVKGRIFAETLNRED